MSLLHEAIDELVAFRDELLRLTGQLSTEHQARLDAAVNKVVDAATAPNSKAEPKSEPEPETPPSAEQTAADGTPPGEPK